MSMRRELRLMSLWSLWASRDQCMSLDFTTATLAVQQRHKDKETGSQYNHPINIPVTQPDGQSQITKSDSK